jgi:hypothetical protein
MKYIPVIFALSLAIMYLVIAVPPSPMSKLACVVLGLALLYTSYCAKGSIGSESSVEGSGLAEGEGLSQQADTDSSPSPDRPRD